MPDRPERINRKKKTNKTSVSNKDIKGSKKTDWRKVCNKLYFWSIPSLIVIMILLSNVLFIFYNKSYFYDEYERLGVYDQIEKQKADTATKNILDYLTGNSGQLSSFFNEKEKLHLEDVKGLVLLDKWIILFLMIAIPLLLFFYIRKFKTNTKDVISRVLIYQGLIMAGLLVCSFLLRGAFSFFFSLFHRIFFTNDMYFLDPATDNLIVLFPQQFFVHAVAAIIIRSLFISAIFLVVGLVLKKKYS